MSSDPPGRPDNSAPRHDSDESKISSDPSRRKSVSSSEIRAFIADQAQTIRSLLAAQRDEAARREADLARQRDEAARREADLVRQRDEAVRREADLVRQRDEAVRRADEERAWRLRLQGAWHCIVS